MPLLDHFHPPLTCTDDYNSLYGMKATLSNIQGDRLIISAEDLAKEFVADKEATKEKYDERWMEVHGKLSKVESNGDATGALVTLEGVDTMFVKCFFSDDNGNWTSDASIGENVALVAQFFGSRYEGNVSLISSLHLKK